MSLQNTFPCVCSWAIAVICFRYLKSSTVKMFMLCCGSLLSIQIYVKTEERLGYRYCFADSLGLVYVGKVASCY